MHKLFSFLCGLLFFCGIVTLLEAQNELILNKMCPILEEEAGLPQYEVEYEGKSVRLCCKKCIKMFKKNPMKWIQRKDPQGNPYLPQFYVSGELTLKGTSEVPPLPETEEQPLTQETKTEEPPQAKIELPKSKLDWFLSKMGTLHPLLVHFPIALIFCAFLLELRQLFQKKNTLSGATKTLLVLGLFFTLFTVPTGWCIAMSQEIPQTLSSYVEWHRWRGITTFIGLGTLVTLISLWEEQSLRLNRLRIIRIFLGLLVGLVAWTAHYGGIITFGPDFFTW